MDYSKRKIKTNVTALVIVNEQKINIMNLKNIKERQPEPQQNSDSTADNLQVSPTCPKPIVIGSARAIN